MCYTCPTPKYILTPLFTSSRHNISVLVSFALKQLMDAVTEGETNRAKLSQQQATEEKIAGSGNAPKYDKGEY